MPRLRRMFLRAGAAVFAIGAVPAHATRIGEADVKAAIIFNVLLFVNWHPVGTGTSVLRVGVVEDAATGAALRALEGQTVGKAKLMVIENPSADEMLECAAIFVGGNNPSALYRVAATTIDAKVLLIGEGSLAVENGAMIGLVLSGDRYVMDVNLAALRREGLSVSSKLLRLARRVME